MWGGGGGEKIRREGGDRGEKEKTRQGGTGGRKGNF